MNVPTQIPTSMGHRRRTSAATPPPANACQTFVTSDGTTRIAAACAGDISNPSKPMDTVGKPSPMAPLTKPANRKTAAVTASNKFESTSAPVPHRTLRDAGASYNAYQRKPLFRFHEAASLPRDAVRCHTFSA
jgi:hypothetical protein